MTSILKVSNSAARSLTSAMVTPPLEKNNREPGVLDRQSANNLNNEDLQNENIFRPNGSRVFHLEEPFHGGVQLGRG